MEGAIYAFQSVDSSESTSATNDKIYFDSCLDRDYFDNDLCLLFVIEVTAPLRKLREGASRIARRANLI